MWKATSDRQMLLQYVFQWPFYQTRFQINTAFFPFLASALRFPVPSRIRAGGICPSGVVLCRGREATTASAPHRPQCQRVEGRGSDHHHYLIMAKVGEGDARWIVSDLKDGTNVNQWHWQETDVLLWCQHKVQKEVLCPANNIKLREHFSSSSSSARSNSDQFIVELMEAKTTGEAYINTRKGKLIAGYELKVVLPFKAKR